MAAADHLYLPHEQQIQELSTALRLLRSQEPHAAIQAEITILEEKLAQVRAEVYNHLTPWDRVTICRHPQRPHGTDYIKALSSDFFELHGDRTFGDDRAVVGGLASLRGMTCMLIAQEKGANTQDRIACNFGMVSPEGFRKALRLMRLAEKLRIPIVSFIDTMGAYPGLEAEQRGQGWVIAENLREMFSIQVPIVVVIVGEGCSGGALGMAVGDAIVMLEHSYYTVISPEGCASILWKDASKKQQATNALQLHAEALLELQIIDHIIAEPIGGAHYDPPSVFDAVENYVDATLRSLKCVSVDVLLEKRFLKFRSIGANNV